MSIQLSNVSYESYPSPNFSERRDNARPTILVMHYTACPTNEALNKLTSKSREVSTHYLVPADGSKVYKLVDETKRAWHAGVSKWKGVSDVNSSSIGIENASWGYTFGWVPSEPVSSLGRYMWSSLIHIERKIGETFEGGKVFAPQKQWHAFSIEQIDTLVVLAKEIMGRWGIEKEDVVGHADIAAQRKVDPGPLFPWKTLAEKGVGVWYNDEVDRVHSTRPRTPSVSWMQESLQNWGYDVPQNGMLDPETRKVIAAFQMHFRPENYLGKVDDESMEILDKLLCQRRNKMDG